MNAPENIEHPENAEHPENPENPENPRNPENPEHPEHPERLEGSAPEEDRAADAPSSEAEPESDVTSLYVRKRRTPTLGFWVALALVVPAVAALLIAPLFRFTDISGVLNFMLVVAVFVGLPLAALAALVDSLRHRGGSRRRR